MTKEEKEEVSARRDFSCFLKKTTCAVFFFFLLWSPSSEGGQGLQRSIETWATSRREKVALLYSSHLLSFLAWLSLVRSFSSSSFFSADCGLLLSCSFFSSSSSPCCAVCHRDVLQPAAFLGNHKHLSSFILNLLRVLKNDFFRDLQAGERR